MTFPCSARRTARRCLPMLLTLIALGARAEVTITFGGDLNLNSSRQAPRTDGALKNGELYPFDALFAGVHGLLTGEINFANVETVISDRTDLPPTAGEFVFTSHPNALRAAARAGLNLFNLSNNHIGDHGLAGIEETLRNLDSVSHSSTVAFSGLAQDRESALRPTVIDVHRPEGHYRVAIISLTALSNAPAQAESNRAGTLYLRDSRDRHEALAALADIQADYKIISLHGGIENVAQVDPGEPELYRQLLAEGDADLILGHHPHRARPVERVGNKLIFYSLGNFLMLGAADLTPLRNPDNYGLFGKLHLSWDARAHRLVAQAVEAIPLTEMQLEPRTLSPRESALRIQVLNTAAKSELGEGGVIFQLDSQGHGVLCLGSNPEARAAAVCRSTQAR